MRKLALEAVREIRKRIMWKPGRDAEHLAKRIRLEHLPPGATMTEYEAIILAVVNDPKAEVYAFVPAGTADLHPTFVAEVGGERWLVASDQDGTIRTAFPPDDPDGHLADPQFIYLGTLEEMES